MSDEERTPDDIVRDMLWNARDARRLRRAVPQSLLGRLAPVAAVIAHHDQTHPGAPRDGAGRVESIVAHTMTLAGEVRADRTRFTDAAAGLHARATGGIDPLLLAHAPAVLRWLPVVVTGPDHHHHDPTSPDQGAWGAGSC